MKQLEALRKYCEDNHLDYSGETESCFLDFQGLLLDKNKVMNLTAVTDPLEIEYKHVMDSLAAAPFIQTLSSTRGSSD